MNEFSGFDTGLNFPPKTQLFLDEVKDNESGLSFSFNDASSEYKTEIKFSSYLMYRVANESYRLRRNEQITSPSFLMRAEKSNFITWFHDESCNQYLDTSVLHFLILSSDDVIDVLCYEPPSVVKVN